MGKHIPPPPGPGRPKGSKNKPLVPFLDDAIALYLKKGGPSWLEEWVDASPLNKRKFMETLLLIAAKLVAEKQEHSGETTMKVNVRFIDVKSDKG
jgi:hypothetical protein